MLQGIDASAVVVPLAHQRRLYKREDLHFKIRFRILPDNEALDHLQPFPDQSGKTYTQNISMSGLGFCGDVRVLLDQSFKEGDFLQIEIHTPNGKTPMRCLGEVAWVEVDEDAEIFRAGVSFTAVNKEDFEQLRMAESSEK